MQNFALDFLEELKKLSDNIQTFYVDYAKPETIKNAIDYINSNTEKIDTSTIAIIEIIRAMRFFFICVPP